MIDSLSKTLKSLTKLKHLSRETLIFRIMPNLFMEVMDRYFRLEVEGLEHLPKKGSAIVLPNHSGYAGLDAMVLSHEIFKRIHRIPRVLTHYLWFVSKKTAIPAQKLGFVEATFANGLRALKNNQLIILFPEGENGNFKPTMKAYQLQEFRRGFVRMAIETGAPVVPTFVIGAEETHINLTKLKFGKELKNLVLPLPFNIFPLPVKWKIKFLPPIDLSHYPKEILKDRDKIREIAFNIQKEMQQELDKELERRPGIFIERPEWLQDVLKNITQKPK